MVDGIKVKVWMKIDVDGSSKTKAISCWKAALRLLDRKTDSRGSSLIGLNFMLFSSSAERIEQW